MALDKKDKDDSVFMTAEPKEKPGEIADVEMREEDNTDPSKDKSINDLRQAMRDAEANLRALVDKLGDSPKNKLNTKITNDNESIKNAGIDQLDDTNQAKFGEFKGLTEFQKNTEKDFAAIMEEEKVDAAQRKAIKTQLEEFHAARLKLLKKSLEEEELSIKDRAYLDLKRDYAFKPEDAGKGMAIDKSKRAVGNFLEDINSTETKTMKDDRGNIIHYSGTVLTANTAVALGLAAAASFKSIEFNGPPLEMLDAAMIALSKGVTDVSLSKETTNALYSFDYFNYKYKKGRVEWYAALEKLKQFEALKEAKITARQTKINNAFNEEPAYSDNANIFHSLSPLSPGQRQFVEGLSQEERVKLADELKDEKFLINNKYYPGDVYIKSLIVDKPGEGKGKIFEQDYAKHVVSNAMEKHLPGKNPSEIASYIYNSKHSPIREEYINQIQNMRPPEGSELTNAEFQGQIRAKVTKFYAAEAAEKSNFFNTWGPKQEFQRRAGKIMTSSNDVNVLKEMLTELQDGTDMPAHLNGSQAAKYLELLEEQCKVLTNLIAKNEHIPRPRIEIEEGENDDDRLELIGGPHR